MARDLPYVGVTFSPQIKANSDWYLYNQAKSFGLQSPTSLPAPTSMATDIGSRTYSFTTRRGRTFELGRVESGECDLSVNNSDGLFDPNNTSSALYPNVVPFRPLAIACAYPLTGNILNDTNNAPYVKSGSLVSSTITPLPSNQTRVSVNANDSNFELGAAGLASNWYFSGGQAPIVNTDAHSGTYSMSVNYSTAPTVLDVPTVAGKQIVASLWYKHTAGSTASTLTIYDGAYSSNTVLNSVSLPFNNSAWTRVSVTATPQANRITLGIINTAVGSVVLIDDVQVEFGSTPTANVTTGPTIYNLFNGFVERYPQTYQEPNRGQVNMVATDAIGSMSQNLLGSVYESLVLQDTSPALYYYPMGEDSSAVGANNNGLYVQQPLVPYTKGTATPVTFGDTSAADGILGAGSTGVTLAHKASGSASPFTFASGTTLVNTNANIVFVPNDTYTFSFWVKFNDSFTAGYTQPFFVSATGPNVPQKQPTVSEAKGTFLGLSTTLGSSSSYGFRLGFADASTSVITTKDAPNFIFNKWYFVSISLTWDGTTAIASLSIPGIDSTVTNLSVATTLAPVINSFGIAGVSQGDKDSVNGVSYAHLTIHQGAISATTYDTVGRLGLYGNSTGTRFKNILNAYSGMKYLPYVSDYGKSQMSNAITVGSALADSVQNISDTEGGTWFIDGEGYVNFKDRWNRLQKLVPSVVFGDGTGETPYQGGDLLINFDPTYVLNEVTVTRDGGGTVSVQDQDSVVSYYPRSYTRTIQNLSDSETADAANFILSRYKDPHARPETLTLTPARNPSVFPVALSLEIGDLVRVNKRPLGAPAISIDCFVERVEHNFDAQSGDWVTHVTLSPAIVYYMNLAAVDLQTSGSAVSGSFVFNKVTVAGGYRSTARDLIPGQTMQYTSGGTTYIDVISGAATAETASTVTFPALRVGSFTNATVTSSLGWETLQSDMRMDATGTFTLSGSFLSGKGYTTFLIDNELVTGSAAGNVLTITARAQYGTKQTASGSALVPTTGTGTVSHFAGTRVYGIAGTAGGNVAANTRVTEILPNNIDASQLPYTVPDFSNYALTSQLASWIGYLNSATITTTTPASGIKYNSMSMQKLIDANNYPSSDLCVGQMLQLNNNLTTPTVSDSFAVVALSAPELNGTWTLTCYKITALAPLLNAAVTPDATTLTFTGNVTASAILIGTEWMQVTAGSGTSTLTVVRGTPDAAVWNPTGKANHYKYDQVYAVVNAGITNTYAKNAPVTEWFSGSSTYYNGTARLGY